MPSSGTTSKSTFKFAFDNCLPWSRRVPSSILLMMISDGLIPNPVARDSLTFATKLSSLTKVSADVSGGSCSRSIPTLTVYVMTSTKDVVVVVAVEILVLASTSATTLAKVVPVLAVVFRLFMRTLPCSVTGSLLGFPSSSLPLSPPVKMLTTRTAPMRSIPNAPIKQHLPLETLHLHFGSSTVGLTELALLFGFVNGVVSACMSPNSMSS